MSRVYLAARDGDDEPLVVKILRSEVTSDKKALERFIEEYNLVGRIQQPARGADPRPWRVGRACLPRNGVLRRRRPEQAPRQQGAAAGGMPADLPRADVRAGRHPRAGHPAPGPEAPEPDVPRRRQPGDPRFRHRQAHRRDRPHRARRDPRHAALHEPGAGARLGARPAHRHLQRRRAAVPDAHRYAPVRRRNRGRGGACTTSTPSRRTCPKAWPPTSA